MDEKEKALINYLKLSKAHQESEAKLSEYEFLPMDEIYNAINEMNKYFTPEEVDHFIINKNEIIR